METVIAGVGERTVAIFSDNKLQTGERRWKVVEGLVPTGTQGALIAAVVAQFNGALADHVEVFTVGVSRWERGAAPQVAHR